jgi:hypothetical protein
MSKPASTHPRPRPASSGPAPSGPGQPEPPGEPVVEVLDEAKCLRLISPGGVGRIGYSGRSGRAEAP